MSTARIPLVYIATTFKLVSGIMESGNVLVDSDQYLIRLKDFLASPLPKSLFSAHPNDVAKPSYNLSSEWETWWDWAASTPEPWIELLGYYVVVSNSDDTRSQADRQFS